MIVTVDAGSKKMAGALMFEGWKLGVESEILSDNIVELCSANDEKVDMILNKFNVKVLHRELMKIVNE